MFTLRQRSLLNLAAWGVLAILAGLLAAYVPLTAAAGGLVLVTLVLIVLVEPALGIVLMLGLAPLKTLIATEAPLLFPVDIGQISLALVVGIWIVHRVTCQRHQPLPHTRIYLPLLGFMLAFSPSLFSAVSTGAWLSEFLKWVEILLLVLIVLDLKARWEWIALGAVLAAVLQAVIGLYEFLGGSGAPHLWLSNYRNFRAFGTFGQPNPFSAFMGLSLPLALGLAWGYASKGFAAWQQHRLSWREWMVPGALAAMYGLCGMLLFGGLIASWGRGAWLGFGAAGTVMVFFASRRGWVGILLLAAGGILLAGLWTMGYLPIMIQQRINNAISEFTGFGDMRAASISDENFAIVERLAHWQAAVSMADAHPFIGVGLGNYEVVYPEYGLPSWPKALGHAHNDYLNLLAETGMIGLAAYLAGWVTILYWTLSALRQPDPVMRGMALGLLGTWTHLAVHSIVDKLYVNNLFLYIGVMLGLLAVAYHHYRRGLCEL